MSAQNPALDRSRYLNPPGTRSTSEWGILLLILTEGALFATMLASYFYIRFNSPTWPLGGIKPPELPLPIIGTVLLLASSATMFWAVRSSARGQPRRLRLGILLTILLGASFIAIQTYEYLNAEFRPNTNVYGSLFFTITGIHGLHLIAGLILCIVILIWAFGNRLNVQEHDALSNVSLYWHFVGLVWLFIFVSLYLSPHW